MSIRRPIKLPSFGNVGAGGTAVCNLPVGARKYHAIIIKYKDGTGNEAAIEAAFTKVRILVNGKAQREATAAEIIDLNRVYNRAFKTGHLHIFFSMASLRTILGEELYGWGTSNLDTLALEIDIAGTEVAPTLTAWAVVEDTLEPLGPIIKWKRFPGKAASGAGEFDVSDLPKKSGAYYALHAFSQYTTDIKVIVDDLSVVDMPRTELVDLYAMSNPALTVNANTVSIVFPFTQQGDQLLPMVNTVQGVAIPVKDFVYRPTLSQAETFNVLAEIVGLAE